jgi:Trk K+ transport system NAD-binding subunit
VNLVEIDLPQTGRYAPRSVVDLTLPRESVLVCIFRMVDGVDQTVIPRGDTELLPGDQVIALTTPEFEDELRAAVLSDEA